MVRALAMVMAAAMWMAGGLAYAQQPQSEHAVARNVILFIADGTGWQSWDAAGFYEAGEPGQRPYDHFAVRMPVTTFADGGGYDAEQAWDATPRDDEHYFAGYHYLKQNATDSAAAATAMAAGVKSYNAAIGVGPGGEPVPNISELALAAGCSAGVVTSVQISHATPAGFVAHAPSRNAYSRIGMEMLAKSGVQVIMGAGHPLYDSGGHLREEGNYQYVGGRPTWRWVSEGKTDWTLIESREQFEALAAQDDPPARVLGLAQVGDKLPTTGALPDDQRTTPDLATMVRGAINVLSRNERGFFLMVEGGAPDWAAHDNNMQRLVHELADFHAAIAAACEWVEANGGWERNLVIVTTDHGNGMLLGPNSDTVAFEPIVNRGQGELPAARWHTGGHTNELVRLWAHGAGSELFAEHVTGRDEHLAARYPGWGPDYTDNTAIFQVIRAALVGDAAAADRADEGGEAGHFVPQPLGSPQAE